MHNFAYGFGVDLPVMFVDGIALARHIDDIAVSQIHNVFHDIGNGHGVTGEEVFSLSQTEHKRRPLTCADKAPWLIFTKRSNRISAAHTIKRCLHGLEQIAVVVKVHELG